MGTIETPLDVKGSNAYVKVLGFDPGKTNFAWSLTEHVATPLRMTSRVVTSGLLPSTIGDLTNDLVKEIDQLDDFLHGLMCEHAPDVVASERFMAQGLRVGTTIEIANIIMGVLLYKSLHHATPMYVTPAVTWKNAYNRAAGRKKALDDVYKACAATPHQVDASLISCWVASEELLCDRFESVADEDSLIEFLESLESTSTHRLRRIRA